MDGIEPDSINPPLQAGPDSVIPPPQAGPDSVTPPLKAVGAIDGNESILGLEANQLCESMYFLDEFFSDGKPASEATLPEEKGSPCNEVKLETNKDTLCSTKQMATETSLGNEQVPLQITEPGSLLCCPGCRLECNVEGLDAFMLKHECKGRSPGNSEHFTWACPFKYCAKPLSLVRGGRIQIYTLKRHFQRKHAQYPQTVNLAVAIIRAYANRFGVSYNPNSRNQVSRIGVQMMDSCRPDTKSSTSGSAPAALSCAVNSPRDEYSSVTKTGFKISFRSGNEGIYSYGINLKKTLQKELRTPIFITQIHQEPKKPSFHNNVQGHIIYQRPFNISVVSKLSQEIQKRLDEMTRKYDWISARITGMCEGSIIVTVVFNFAPPHSAPSGLRILKSMFTTEFFTSASCGVPSSTSLDVKEDHVQCESREDFVMARIPSSSAAKLFDLIEAIALGEIRKEIMIAKITCVHLPELPGGHGLSLVVDFIRKILRVKPTVLQLVIDYWGFSTVPSPVAIDFREEYVDLTPASEEFKSKFLKIFEQTKSEASDVSRIKHEMVEYYEDVFGILGIDCTSQEKERMTGLFISYLEPIPPIRCYCGGPNDTAHKYRLEQHVIANRYRELCEAIIDDNIELLEAHSAALDKLLHSSNNSAEIEDDSQSTVSPDPMKWDSKTLGKQVEGWIDSKYQSKLRVSVSNTFVELGIDGKDFFSRDEKAVTKFLVTKLKMMSTSLRRTVVKRWKQIVAAHAVKAAGAG